LFNRPSGNEFEVPGDRLEDYQFYYATDTFSV
jgi:hypothetical protein